MRAFMSLPSVLSLSPDQLGTLLTDHGEARYRTNQILDWVWKKRITSWEDMRNLPGSLRDILSSTLSLRTLTHVRTQGEDQETKKFLFRLEDDHLIESVLIPASPALYGEPSDRHTLCVSSQVGCLFGCKFCASGLDGFIRHLNASEIVEQILLAESLAGVNINNIVFMGMGEPLDNWDNFTQALDLINSPRALNIGARHLTVSSAGHADHIRRLAEDPRQIRLAVSLHAATDEVRSQIMPINRKWPIDALMEALTYWTSKKKQLITLEYILIDKLNTDDEQLNALIRHARRLRAKINLIPYNPVLGLPWVRPNEATCYTFRNRIRDAGIPVTLRMEKGTNIDAACGQLRRKTLTEENSTSTL